MEAPRGIPVNQEHRGEIPVNQERRASLRARKWKEEQLDDEVKDQTSLLIEAQERTTHAVRALAVFFFVNLFWCCVAGIFVWAAALTTNAACYDIYGGVQCDPAINFFAIIFWVLAVITALVGTYVTLKMSIRELRASRRYDTWM